MPESTVSLPLQGAAPSEGQDRCNTALPRMLASEALFRGGREVQISHRGKVYRLLKTRAGKLLLNC